MDVSKELEGTQEETEELTDEQLAAIADENGEDIPVYHLDVSATDPEAVEALLEEAAEKAEEVALIERPAEGKPAKAVGEKITKAVDEDGKKPRKARAASGS